MEEEIRKGDGGGIVSSPVSEKPAEETMLREDVVREILARLSRGEGVKRIAREIGVDRKTVKRWRRLGEWQPRVSVPRARAMDAYAEFVQRRGPEVGWNGSVIHRELCEMGFRGSYRMVDYYLRPLRDRRRWAQDATIRFETAPGEQAQIDFGAQRLWIADGWHKTKIFVFTLGFSRRVWARAYPGEPLVTVLDAHERAFRHFGGVPLTCLYDNPRTLVLGRSAGKVLWHPVIEDFARHWGFTPRACQPYRARTKGKVESGVKYVKRNALAGRRFLSWDHLNAWLEEWSTTVADQRIHGTTHERPIDRFAREALTPIGDRPPYSHVRVAVRKVPSDALVAIASARYSVPVRFVGETVTVHETASHYEIFHRGESIARHEKATRHAVIMDRAHYAGLLRPGRSPNEAAIPPRWDPAFLRLGEVPVRDLSVYEAIANGGGTR